MSAEDVAFFNVFPGFDPKQIKNAADSGYRAIIVEGYACGTVPDIGEKGICPAVEHATKKGVPVFLISGVYVADPEGFALRVGYESQVNAIKAGITPLETPTCLDFIDVINELGRILDECDDPDEVRMTMTKKYCKPGYGDRMKNTQNVLSVLLE